MGIGGSRALTVQPDGNILVAGSASLSPGDFLIARYLDSGVLDSTFGSDGIVTIDLGTASDHATAIATQQDWKILVAGFSIASGLQDFSLIRCNLDGTLDPSFGSGGKVLTPVGAVSNNDVCMALHPDGDILLGGSYETGQSEDIVVIKYNPDGTYDNTFGSGGIALVDVENEHQGASDITVQVDGKVVIAGISYTNQGYPEWIVARLDVNGLVDSTFDDDGIFLTAIGSDALTLVVQPDDKIVVAGSGPSAWALIRLNVDGSYDPGFGFNGQTLTWPPPGTNTTGPRDIALQPDGKVLAVGGLDYGSHGVFAVIRYDANGALDHTFDFDGMSLYNFGLYSDAYSIALQPDLKILVTGSIYDTTVIFGAARYLSGLDLGTITFSASAQTVLIYPNPVAQGATLQYTLNAEETISIHLIDAQGKTLATFVDREKQSAGSHQQPIPFPEPLAPGSYLIVISSLSGQVAVQVVK
jgi:uncharacterized delta-60 repeat protein